MTAMNTLAIIGGGAAGLAAAVAAGRAARFKGLEVRIVVFEADERVGRSILATGNGRCNFSNAEVPVGLYRNGSFVGQAMAEFEGLADFYKLRKGRRSWPNYGDAVRDFFESIGLAWREEGEGRLYPYANKASSVLDALRGACRAYGAEERCGCAVALVELPYKEGARFTLRMADGSFERADAVVVACGGRVARGLLPDGFPYADPRAVLGPLATEAHLARQLDNIRVRAEVRLMRDGRQLACESGEVLFRKYGLSGIAVFNLSRFAEKGDVVEVDLLPFLRDCDVEAFAFSRYRSLASLHGGAFSCGRYLDGLVLPQVARVILKDAGYFEEALLQKSQAPNLVRVMKGLSFAVEGIADERQCQVHRGGFAVKSFSPYTMEALEATGLFAAGEALDVDAPCGGYNLHWAWTSGAVAGFSAIARLAGEDLRSWPASRFGDDCGEESPVFGGDAC